MKRIASSILAVSLLGGCGDSVEPNLGHGDVTSSDVRNPDTVPEGPLAIAVFQSNFESISRGKDSLDRDVDGVATLEWRTTGAASVEVLVDGLPISLAGCVPASGVTDCAEAGSLAVRPSQDTRFTLRAVGPDGACETTCPEATVEVAVKAPVRAYLDYERSSVEAGSDVLLPFAIHDAVTYSLGVASVDTEGRPILLPCADFATPGDAPCTVEVDSDDAPVTGFFRMSAVSKGFTVGVLGTNGAADGLGDLSVGDLEFVFNVPILVHSFTATPEAFLPGDDVVLAWDVAGAQSLSVTTDSTAFSGLSTCVGLGTDGTGFCTLTADSAAPIGEALFVLTALQDTGLTGEAQATVEVVAGPRIRAFTSALDVVVPGQTFELAWTAFAADSVVITAAPAVLEGLTGCTALGANGGGSCQVTVAAGAALGDLSLTLKAANTKVGPPVTASVTVAVAAAPKVLSFGFDDDTRMAGETASLRWTATGAERFVLQSDSGAISQGTLDACTATAPSTGGACVLALPEGLSPGAITFTLVAIGPTTARSELATTSLTIGTAPEVAFSVTPDNLPELGGSVNLVWTAPTANRVVVTDSASELIVVLDTTDAPLCSGEIICDPKGDTFAVTLTQPTSFTLVAHNDFGTSIATANVSLEGAPFIVDLRVKQSDVSSGPVLVDDETAPLAWTIENLGAADRVILQRAAVTQADASCDGLSSGSWSVVDGFPRTGVATGTADLTALTATAQCFRLIAEGTATTPPQRDAVTFKVYRRPSVTSFTVADDTVRLGDVVNFSWDTKFVHRVALSVSPVGAVTSQDLGRCSAATGSCAVTIQSGTPLGELRFSLNGTGEESSQTREKILMVTVGNGAHIEAFTVNPGSLTSTGDVTLSWVTVHGATVTIRDGTAEVFSSSAPATVASGQHVVKNVKATETWILTATNAFGAETAQVTTFVGAAIDSLTVNGGNALDGEERVITGPVTISWSTTSADGFHRLESAPAPSTGTCATATLVWGVRYLKDDAPANSASHADGVLTSNRCYRLTVGNAQTPPQTSSAIFLVREVPEITRLQTSVAALPPSGGTVIIEAGIRGATALTMTAEYRDAAGGLLGTRAVCTQSTLNTGTLTGGANVDEVSCAHRIVPCSLGLLCLNNGMPAATTSVRYLVTVADQENDQATAATAADEDVRID